MDFIKYAFFSVLGLLCATHGFAVPADAQPPLSQPAVAAAAREAQPAKEQPSGDTKTPEAENTAKQDALDIAKDNAFCVRTIDEGKARLAAQRAKCTKAQEENEELTEECRKVFKCVPLEKIKLSEDKPAALQEGKPMPPNALPTQPLAPAAPEPIRLGAFALEEEALTPTPAVLHQDFPAVAEPAVLRDTPLAMKATAPKAAVSPRPAVATPEALRPVPASLGDPQAAARDTLSNSPTGSATDIRGMVTGGEGRISSGFGPRERPCAGCSTNHKGVDVAAARGTPVTAAADGVVTFSGWADGYGLMVKIDHGNGVETRYAHLNPESGVAMRGTRVRAGQNIGGVGTTGRSTGYHLHFETRIAGNAVDPMGKGMVALAGLRGTPLNATELAALNRSTPTQFVPSGGVRTGNQAGAYTATSYQTAGYGGSLDAYAQGSPQGYPYPVQFMPAQAMPYQGYGAGQIGGIQVGGGMAGPNLEAQGYGAPLEAALQVEIPVIYLQPEDYATYMETGKVPSLTPRQNAQFLTNCENQEVNDANEALLRDGCKTQDKEIIIGSGDAVV